MKHWIASIFFGLFFTACGAPEPTGFPSQPQPQGCRNNRLLADLSLSGDYIKSLIDCGTSTSIEGERPHPATWNLVAQLGEVGIDHLINATLAPGPSHSATRYPYLSLTGLLLDFDEKAAGLSLSAKYNSLVDTLAVFDPHRAFALAMDWQTTISPQGTTLLGDALEEVSLLLEVAPHNAVEGVIHEALQREEQRQAWLHMTSSFLDRKDIYQSLAFLLTIETTQAPESSQLEQCMTAWDTAIIGGANHEMCDLSPFGVSSTGYTRYTHLLDILDPETLARLSHKVLTTFSNTDKEEGLQHSVILTEGMRDLALSHHSPSRSLSSFLHFLTNTKVSEMDFLLDEKGLLGVALEQPQAKEVFFKVMGYKKASSQLNSFLDSWILQGGQISQCGDLEFPGLVATSQQESDAPIQYLAKIVNPNKGCHHGLPPLVIKALEYKKCGQECLAQLNFDSLKSMKIEGTTLPAHLLAKLLNEAFNRLERGVQRDPFYLYSQHLAYGALSRSQSDSLLQELREFATNPSIPELILWDEGLKHSQWNSLLRDNFLENLVKNEVAHLQRVIGDFEGIFLDNPEASKRQMLASQHKLTRVIAGIYNQGPFSAALVDQVNKLQDSGFLPKNLGNTAPHKASYLLASLADINRTTLSPTLMTLDPETYQEQMVSRFPGGFNFPSEYGIDGTKAFRIIDHQGTPVLQAASPSFHLLEMITFGSRWYSQETGLAADPSYYDAFSLPYGLEDTYSTSWLAPCKEDAGCPLAGEALLAGYNSRGLEDYIKPFITTTKLSQEDWRKLVFYYSRTMNLPIGHLPKGAIVNQDPINQRIFHPEMRGFHQFSPATWPTWYQFAPKSLGDNEPLKNLIKGEVFADLEKDFFLAPNSVTPVKRKVKNTDFFRSSPESLKVLASLDLLLVAKEPRRARTSFVSPFWTYQREGKDILCRGGTPESMNQHPCPITIKGGHEEYAHQIRLLWGAQLCPLLTDMAPSYPGGTTGLQDFIRQKTALLSTQEPSLCQDPELSKIIEENYARQDHGERSIIPDHILLQSLRDIESLGKTPRLLSSVAELPLAIAIAKAQRQKNPKRILKASAPLTPYGRRWLDLFYIAGKIIPLKPSFVDTYLGATLGLKANGAWSPQLVMSLTDLDRSSVESGSLVNYLKGRLLGRNRHQTAANQTLLELLVEEVTYLSHQPKLLDDLLAAVGSPASHATSWITSTINQLWQLATENCHKGLLPVSCDNMTASWSHGAHRGVKLLTQKETLYPLVELLSQLSQQELKSSVIWLSELLETMGPQRQAKLNTIAEFALRLLQGQRQESPHSLLHNYDTAIKALTLGLDGSPLVESLHDIANIITSPQIGFNQEKSSALINPEKNHDALLERLIVSLPYLIALYQQNSPEEPFFFRHLTMGLLKPLDPKIDTSALVAFLQKSEWGFQGQIDLIEHYLRNNSGILQKAMGSLATTHKSQWLDALEESPEFLAVLAPFLNYFSQKAVFSDPMEAPNYRRSLAALTRLSSQAGGSLLLRSQTNVIKKWLQPQHPQWHPLPTRRNEAIFFKPINELRSLQ